MLRWKKVATIATTRVASTVLALASTTATAIRSMHNSSSPPHTRSQTASSAAASSSVSKDIEKSQYPSAQSIAFVATAATVTLASTSLSDPSSSNDSDKSESSSSGPSPTDSKYIFRGTLQHLAQLPKEVQLRLSEIYVERSMAECTSDDLQAAAAAVLWPLVKESTSLRVFRPYGALYDRKELNAAIGNLDAKHVASLAEALQQNRSIRSLDVSGLRLSDSAAVTICDALASSTTLTELNLSNNDLNGLNYESGTAFTDRDMSDANVERRSQPDTRGRGSNAVAQLIRRCNTLTTLDLSFNTKLNLSHSLKPIADAVVQSRSLRSLNLACCGLKDEGATIIATALQTPTCSLESLNIGRNGISSAGALQLSSVLPTSRTIRELNIELNSAIGSAGATAIADAVAQSASLTALHIGWCGIGTIGGSALAKSIQINTKLQVLGLECNNIGEEGAKALASALQQSRSELHTLKLSENSMGDAGTTAVATAIASKPHFQELYVDENKIGTAGIQAVCDALTHCPSLHTLNLSYNDLSVEACNAVAAALPLSGVTHLGLVSCKLDPTKLNILANGLQTEQQQQQPRYRNSLLTNLSLDNNELLGDAGAKILAETLQKQARGGADYPGLTSLNLHFSNMGDSGAQAFAAVLPSSNLTKLHIGGATRRLFGNNVSRLGDAGVAALAQAVARSKNMQMLDIRTNFDMSDALGPTGVTALVDAFRSSNHQCCVWLLPGLHNGLPNHLRAKVDAMNNFKFA